MYTCATYIFASKYTVTGMRDKPPVVLARRYLVYSDFFPLPSMMFSPLIFLSSFLSGSLASAPKMYLQYYLS